MVFYDGSIFNIEVEGMEGVIEGREFSARVKGIIGGQQVKIGRERHGDVPFVAKATRGHAEVNSGTSPQSSGFFLSLEGQRLFVMVSRWQVNGCSVILCSVMVSRFSGNERCRW